MPKIRIQHFGKNGVLIGDPIEIDSEYVPRVGEILDSEALLSREESNNLFMVTSVVSKVTEAGIMPCITAKTWFKGLRSELLEEYGWLPQTSLDTYLSYDEDIYFDS